MEKFSGRLSRTISGEIADVFRLPPDQKSYFYKNIEIRESSVHGLGVFATQDIPIHTCFEISPVVIFDRSLMQDWLDMYDERHILNEYLFQSYDKQHAVVLGFGSIYNHSAFPNAFYRWRECEKFPAMEFWSKRAIVKNEEIFVKYTHYSDTLQFMDEKESKYLGLE